MRATAIIPVKRFHRAKQRLEGGLEPTERRELAEQMLTDVFDAVSRSEAIERVMVVTGEPVAQELAMARGFELVDDPADSGHPQAAGLGVARAIELGARCVALLPGDCPLMDPRELDELLATVAEPSVTIVPDRHATGTNGLLLAPPDAIEPSFGPGSCARHAALAEASGVPHAVERVASLALDVDTAEDLELWRESS